jgi:peptidoglycan/LPS O-acetylase OafA/YrhL
LESPNRDKSREVEELRGWAALLVLFYHSMHSGAAAIGIREWLDAGSNPLAAIVFEGHTGVALFMVLSGYILARGTFGKDISYAGFLRNRFLRIFPLMMVVLVFSLYTAKDLDLGKIIAPLMLLANTKAAFTDPSGLAGTVWTISVEFQFYLIAPFLFLFADRRGLRFLLSAMVLFWLLRMIVLLPLRDDPAEMYRVSYFTIVGRINQFMIGLGLAYLFETDRLTLNGSRKVGFVGLALASVAATVLLMVLNRSGGIGAWHSWRIVYPEVEGLIGAAFIAAYLVSRPFEGWRLGGLMSGIGTISFSIYILHYAIQREFWNIIYPHFFGGTLTGLRGVFVTTALIAVPIVAMAALSYKCIEKPFQDMRGKYLKDRAVPATVLSPPLQADGTQGLLSKPSLTSAAAPRFHE